MPRPRNRHDSACSFLTGEQADALILVQNRRQMFGAPFTVVSFHITFESHFAIGEFAALIGQPYAGVAAVHELLLQRIFAGIRLTERQVGLIKSSFVPRKFKRGQFYQRAGEVTTHGGFVVEGCFRTYVTDEKGRENILHFSPETAWIGDIQSATTGMPTATGRGSSGRRPPNNAGLRCSCTHPARNAIWNS